MHLGDHAWLGREPTPADESMWPTPVFYVSMGLLFLSLPAGIVAFFAAAYACGVEHADRKHGRMGAALASGLVGPAALLLIKHDPVGAFGWFFD